MTSTRRPRFERPLVAVPIRVPIVRLSKDEIFLLWEFQAPRQRRVEGRGTTHGVNPEPGILEDFIRLADAAPARFVTYCEKWGPLGFGKPLPAGTGVELIPQVGSKGVELIPLWRQLARQARATMAAAGNLWNQQPVAAGTWAEIGVHVAHEGQGLRGELARGWFAIHYVIDTWLGVAGVRPTILYDMEDPTESPRIALGSRDAPTFAALAIQLLYAVMRRRGLAFCSGCAHPYEVDRLPQRGRRNYCPTCIRSGVRASDLKRAQRERDAARRARRRTRR